MAQNKIECFGPVALTTTLTTNIIHPAAAGASAVGYTATASFILLRHVLIVSKSASPQTFSLWLGATGANTAGTELFGNARTVAANGSFEWFGLLRITSSQYIVGGAGANTVLTFQAEGEVGLE